MRGGYGKRGCVRVWVEAQRNRFGTAWQDRGFCAVSVQLVCGFCAVSVQLVWRAVKRCRSSVGAIPTRQLSLQPVAIGAAMEVTRSPKPSMERVVLRPREQAGRNVSERRAGLEKHDVGADPAIPRGRPLS